MTSSRRAPPTTPALPSKPTRATTRKALSEMHTAHVVKCKRCGKPSALEPSRLCVECRLDLQSK